LLLGACDGGSSPSPAPSASPAASPVATPTASSSDDEFRIGRPQQRREIGDVDRALRTFESTRGELIDLFKAQEWFQDGLSRDEALFVERSLSFVTRYGGPRKDYVSDETVRRKLIRYARVPVADGEVELLLIFQSGQAADMEMEYLKATLPALESLVGVQFPERVITVINGDFEINDFNDGQFIRIARCCTLSASILAHELSHAYWSIGKSWFNEGMADIYSVLVQQRLSDDPPAAWRVSAPDLDAYLRSRRSAASRFPELPLPRRFASNGLYEAADVFLLEIRALIGDGAFKAAARDLYLASDFNRFNVSDKRIEDVFLVHADAGAREGVMALFNRYIWGDNGERYRQLQEWDEP